MIHVYHGRIQRERERGSGLLLPGMSQVAKVSLEILVRTPLEMQLDPLGPTASRGRIVRPSVKYVDEKKNVLVPPPPPQHTHPKRTQKSTEFSGSTQFTTECCIIYHHFFLLLIYSIDTRNSSINKQFSSHLVGEERVGCFTFLENKIFSVKVQMFSYP